MNARTMRLEPEALRGRTIALVTLLVGVVAIGAVWVNDAGDLGVGSADPAPLLEHHVESNGLAVDLVVADAWHNQDNQETGLTATLTVTAAGGDAILFNDVNGYFGPADPTWATVQPLDLNETFEVFALGEEESRDLTFASEAPGLGSVLVVHIAFHGYDAGNNLYRDQDLFFEVPVPGLEAAA